MSKGITALGPALVLESWIDPLEQAFRSGVHSYLQGLLEQEVSGALGRLRHSREATAKGYRHGHRGRTLVGTFGRVELSVPGARIENEGGTKVKISTSAKGEP